MISVYGIYNTVANKWYVGSSTGTHRRWIQHQSDLKRGVHINNKLQRAYNKYGKDAFEYHILSEYQTDCNLDHYEQLWSILLQAGNKTGYCIKVGNRNGKISEESRKKMSISAKKRGPRPVTEETKEKIRKSLTGVKHSDERRKKIGDVQRGKKLPDWRKKQISDGLKKAYAEGRRKNKV